MARGFLHISVEVKTALACLALIGLIGVMGMASMPRVSPSAASAQEDGLTRAFIVPVHGVARRHLSDTWGAARSQGRQHEGIDIMAPRGTPVHAAADGRILNFANSARGGTAIYQADSSGQYVLYYAHLDGYAPGLVAGADVIQGQVIGYVGSTGNATTPHLHFEIHRTATGASPYRGRAINPYPVLIRGEITATSQN